MKARFLVFLMVFLLGFLMIYTAWDIYTKPKQTNVCSAENISCARDLHTKNVNCIPSSTIVKTKDGITIMINITRIGDKCVRTERVLDAEGKDYLIGYKVNCSFPLNDMKDPKVLKNCSGSLYDYLVPEEGGEGGGGDSGAGEGTQETPTALYCPLNDIQCKEEAKNRIVNCIDSEITNVEFRWEPDGYWTAYTEIQRTGEVCEIYMEILNAVNIPPGVPADIIGYNLTCEVPVTELPYMEQLTSQWCSGKLLDYLYD